MAGRQQTTSTQLERARQFGRLLARARHGQGLSQETLAHVSGIAVSTLRNIESGRTADPGFSVVVRVADPLGVDLMSLAVIIRGIESDVEAGESSSSHP